MYSDDGFAVAIDDFWYGDTPDEDYNRKISRRITRVLLLPKLEVTLERLHARNPDEGSFKQVLERAIRSLQAGIQVHPKTGWLVIDGRSLRLYPTATKPADNSPCVSGVLLSLAGMPTPDFSDRVMNVSGYVLDKNDPGAEGAANPCQSNVIITAIEVSIPDA